MRSTHTEWCRRSVLGAAAVLALCLFGAREAQAGHIFHCDGEFSGYLFDYYWEGDCYSWGYWHVSVDTNTGHFNFHFHGDTDDSYCFGEHGDIYEWCPEWVHDELRYECGLCIVYEERTHYSIDHHGHVFLKCTGYVEPCYYCDE